jgi:hypothetical protein
MADVTWCVRACAFVCGAGIYNQNATVQLYPAVLSGWAVAQGGDRQFVIHGADNMTRVRNFCRQRTDTPWHFLRRANLNNEDRILFVARFLETLMDDVIHDRHPCPRAVFVNANDRVAYEQVWRDVFYRALTELPASKRQQEELMQLQPHVQLERLKAVHPQESTKDAFVLAFNALPEDERHGRYRPLQAFLDYWPRLAFTSLAAGLSDLYCWLHDTCNHLLREDQALEYSVSALMERYAQVNPIVGNYLRDVYQKQVVDLYNRYVDFRDGTIAFQCRDDNRFEKISPDQKVCHFLSLTAEDDAETGDWAYRIINVLLKEHNDFLTAAGVTDAMHAHPRQLSSNTSYILHARYHKSSICQDSIQEGIASQVCPRLMHWLMFDTHAHTGVRTTRGTSTAFRGK